MIRIPPPARATLTRTIPTNVYYILSLMLEEKDKHRRVAAVYRHQNLKAIHYTLQESALNR